MTPALHSLAQYDGWTFSATGNTAIKKNGTTRRLSDLHYDRWSWLMPVYGRIATEFAGDKRLIAIHSAVLLGDIEMVGELCGRVV
jgi:hypothetical protein